MIANVLKCIILYSITNTQIQNLRFNIQVSPNGLMQSSQRVLSQLPIAVLVQYHLLSENPKHPAVFADVACLDYSRNDQTLKGIGELHRKRLSVPTIRP